MLFFSGREGGLLTGGKWTKDMAAFAFPDTAWKNR